MFSTKTLINLFLFAIVFGVALQVLVQTSLAPPLQDALMIGRHLNRYDVQMRNLKEKKNSGGLKLKSNNNADHKKNNKDDPTSFLKTIDELGEAYGTGATMDNNQARDLYLTVLKDTQSGFDAWLDAHMQEREQKLLASQGKKSTTDGDKEEEAEIMAEELEHAAVLCSVARSRTRRYVRDRMADRFGAWSLFARDAWQHGGRHLAGAIASDVKDNLNGLLNGGVSEEGEESVIDNAQQHKQKREKSLNMAATGLDDDNTANSKPSGKKKSRRSKKKVSKSGAALASIGACLSADDNHPCPSFSYLHEVRNKDAESILNSCFSSNQYYNRHFSTEGRMKDQQQKKVE